MGNINLNLNNEHDRNRLRTDNEHDKDYFHYNLIGQRDKSGLRYIILSTINGGNLTLIAPITFKYFEKSNYLPASIFSASLLFSLASLLSISYFLLLASNKHKNLANEIQEKINACKNIFFYSNKDTAKIAEEIQNYEDKIASISKIERSIDSLSIINFKPTLEILFIICVALNFVALSLI